jgi:hypothetical protein
VYFNLSVHDKFLKSFKNELLACKLVFFDLTSPVHASKYEIHHLTPITMMWTVLKKAMKTKKAQKA